MVNEQQRGCLDFLLEENPIKGFKEFLDLDPPGSNHDVGEAIRILEVLHTALEDKTPINYCTLRETQVRSAPQKTLLKRLIGARFVELQRRGPDERFYISYSGIRAYRGLTGES